MAEKGRPIVKSAFDVVAHMLSGNKFSLNMRPSVNYRDKKLLNTDC